MEIDGTLNDAGFRRKMNKLIQNFRNPRGMKRVAGIMHDAVEENFSKEGRPTRWKRLAPSTLKARARQGKTGKILQVSGSMAASVWQKYTNTSAAVGTNKSYAKYHHPPSMTKHASKGIMPVRAFILLTKEDYRKINKVIGRNLIQGVN